MSINLALLRERTITYLKQNNITIISMVLACILLISSIPYLKQSSINKSNNIIVKKFTENRNSSKQALKQSPLFGEYISNINDKTKIPNTLLNLTLVGILKSSIAKDSQALIKVGSNDEKLYFINESLPGGATLIRILNQEVLLKLNGQIERLSLPKEELNLKSYQDPLKFED